MRKLWNLAILILIFGCMPVEQKDSTQIQDMVQPFGIHETFQNGIKFTYSGSGFQCTFSGEEIRINYECSSDENFIMIVLNGKAQHFKLDEGQGKIILKNGQREKNELKIYKQTEARNGSFTLTHLNGKDIAPIPLPQQRITWLGNSITCGYGNAVSIPAPPKGNPATGYHAENQINYNAFSSIVSRRLNAEASQMCYSGKGIYRNYDQTHTTLIPEFYTQLEPGKRENRIPKEQLQSDLYVILAGTNDFGGEIGPENLVDSSLFVNAYVEFLNKIEQYHSGKPLLLLGSNMLSASGALMQRERMIKYLEAVIKTYQGSMKVHFLPLDFMQGPFGENWHPSSEEHKRMANQVEAYILKQQLL